jgi:hypothetical protein
MIEKIEIPVAIVRQNAVYENASVEYPASLPIQIAEKLNEVIDWINKTEIEGWRES